MALSDTSCCSTQSIGLTPQHIPVRLWGLFAPGALRFGALAIVSRLRFRALALAATAIVSVTATVPLLVFVLALLLACAGQKSQKILEPFLELCVSSLRRGHANLLCIVPILSVVPKNNLLCADTIHEDWHKCELTVMGCALCPALGCGQVTSNPLASIRCGSRSPLPVIQA